mmetsp:Transcript_11040/g.38951  ORF Transcript_11040/g.38951 Transcript_11040/m.38951 type:complete len:203 (-) Transcript_11040:384-992(-)
MRTPVPQRSSKDANCAAQAAKSSRSAALKTSSLLSNLMTKESPKASIPTTSAITKTPRGSSPRMASSSNLKYSRRSSRSLKNLSSAPLRFLMERCPARKIVGSTMVASFATFSSSSSASACSFGLAGSLAAGPLASSSTTGISTTPRPSLSYLADSPSNLVNRSTSKPASSTSSSEALATPRTSASSESRKPSSSGYSNDAT